MCLRMKLGIYGTTTPTKDKYISCRKPYMYMTLHDICKERQGVRGFQIRG